MKKAWACMLAMCLLLSAVPAWAAEHDFSGAFTITCPDHWEWDNEFDTQGNTDTYQCLGAFLTKTSTVEICVSDDRTYHGDYTLPVKMNSDYFAYVSGLLSMMEESGVESEYVCGLTNEKGDVTFAVLYVDDNAGGYYYADAMIGGCTLSMYAYSNTLVVDTGARQLAELETLIDGLVFNDSLFE